MRRIASVSAVVTLALLASFAHGQNRAVVPAIAATLPGNAAMSMPLRWSHGVFQCCIGSSLLPATLAGGQLQGIRMRRPSFVGEPDYPALQRTLTVRAAFTPLVPSAMGGFRAANAPANLATVFGPAPFSVAATTQPTGAPWLGDEYVVIPFSPPLPVTPGSLFLEFETSDLPFRTADQWVDAVWIENGVEQGYSTTVGEASCTTRATPLEMRWTSGASPTRGIDAVLRLTGAPPAAPNGLGSVVLAWLGVEPQTHALAGDFLGYGADLASIDPTLAGCRQWSPLDYVVFGLADAAGGFDLRVLIPTAPTTVGMRLGAQAAFLDSSRTGVLPLSVSNGVMMQLDTSRVGAQCSSVYFPYAYPTSPWGAHLGLMPVLVLDF
jgi:hypothetical protein